MQVGIVDEKRKMEKGEKGSSPQPANKREERKRSSERLMHFLEVVFLQEAHAP